jgi:hypothetical protein
MRIDGHGISFAQAGEIGWRARHGGGHRSVRTVDVKP